MALWLLLPASSLCAALPDLSTVPFDLKAPMVLDDRPATGLRVRQTAPRWENTAVHHTLWLPVNWKPGGQVSRARGVCGQRRQHKQGHGRHLARHRGDLHLGYGISGGSNYIWVCLPFVARAGVVKSNAPTWWGDVNETIAYCTNTVRHVCASFGGDPDAVVLCGFSRGAIACNFIGLHDDELAPLWRFFSVHRHYDGVNTNWPYAGADRISERARLARLQGWPQFISHEGSTAATVAWLRSTGVEASFTFEPIPFRKHSDQWVLRDIPARRRLRAWLQALGLP